MISVSSWSRRSGEATCYTRRIPLKLRDIAERLQCRLEGDGELDIVRVAGIQQAQPGDLTFVANPRYMPELATTRASAVILGPGKTGDPAAPCAALHTDDPYSAFARAVSLFAKIARAGGGRRPPQRRRRATRRSAPTCRLGRS